MRKRNSEGDYLLGQKEDVRVCRNKKVSVFGCDDESNVVWGYRWGRREYFVSIGPGMLAPLKPWLVKVRK